MTSTYQPETSGAAKERCGEVACANSRPSRTLKRRLKASPEQVFAAWTDPEKVSHWFHCGDASVIDASFDVRVGGAFTLATRKSHGEENRASGVYREVVPNRKLVFTWVHDRNPSAETLVTLLLAPDGAGCLLTLTHEMFADEFTRDQNNNGWTGCLDNLEAYLAA
jgi:uncharacterized protein YndB with AHSA1/START domain